LVAALFLVGPRVVLFFAWLLSDWYAAFDSRMIALLGFLFLPWTSLAWMFVFFFHGGALGGGWVLPLVFGLLLDAGAYGGSHRARRDNSTR
jgi:hypothetical protein